MAELSEAVPGRRSETPETLDPMVVVRELTELPHRGATTENERLAADRLERRLKALGAQVSRQAFTTPKTYVWMVSWMLGGLVLALLLAGRFPWDSTLLALLCAAGLVLFLDWRWSPAMLLPPRGRSENLVATMPAPERGDAGRRKLILMAHFDSAPVSLLYAPTMVKGFHRSMLISIGVLAAAVLAIFLTALGVGASWLPSIRGVLVAYFVVQALLTVLDYLRIGYTNGAADNATGAAAALSTAARLWASPLAGWDVELLLTGAEEVGMMGATSYVRGHARELDPKRTFILNFDNVGAGKLRVITRTGTITPVRYDNPLVRSALATASEQRFEGIAEGSWHTGDFDTLAFARAGFMSLTLSAQDEKGLIPNLHRPSDVLENVDAAVPRQAVEFALATVRRLAQS